LVLKTVQYGKIDPGNLFINHFKLDHIMEAYDCFENAGKNEGNYDQ
jgi:alcohol dehydrogenase